MAAGNASGGSHTNTATASGVDDEGNTAADTATATVTYVNSAPSITVDKSVVNINEGNTATYTFAITNTSPASTDPVVITSVQDSVLGDLTAAAEAAWVAQGNTGAIVLVQNQTFTFTVATAVLNAGTVSNTVTVTGRDDEFSPVSATDSATLLVANVAPAITVDKSGPSSIVEGNTATYSFTITNTSSRQHRSGHHRHGGR